MAVVNGVSRIGYMRGGKAALWKDEDMADVFTREGRDRSSTRTRDKTILPLLCSSTTSPRAAGAASTL